MMKRLLISVLASLLLLITALFHPMLHLTEGESMEPTIHDGQIILSVIPSRIERMDVVLIKTAQGLLLKRVIGVPGDTVQIHNGRAYVNGEIFDELETKHAGIAVLPIFLAEGEYFVLGDNRDVSLDSRYADIGIINEGQILRKVILFRYPLRLSNGYLSNN